MDTLAQLRELLGNDYSQLKTVMAEQLETSVELISEMSQHIVGSGGKRIRPLVVMLSAKACGYDGDKHIVVGAAVEFFHTATLLHDDIVDESELRRGKQTANNVWGTKATILVGDYMFTNAFKSLVASENLDVFSALAHAATDITRGEVSQFMAAHDQIPDEARYYQVIHDKTASLFGASAKVGPILTNQSDEVINAMGAYGIHLGNAFQIIDDCLDLEGDSEQLGKNCGDDLREGKITLPLIHTLKHAQASERDVLHAAIKTPNDANIRQVLEIIKAYNGVDTAKLHAKQQVQQGLAALDILPESPYKQGLKQLAEFAIRRVF